MVLTLQPATAFLVPLDKCLALAQESLRRPDPGAPRLVHVRDLTLVSNVRKYKLE